MKSFHRKMTGLCTGFPRKLKPIYIAEMNEWCMTLTLISADFDLWTASYQLAWAL